MMDQAQARFCIEGIAAMLHEGWSPVNYVKEDETDYIDLEALLRYLALLGGLNPEEVLLDIIGTDWNGLAMRQGRATIMEPKYYHKISSENKT